MLCADIPITNYTHSEITNHSFLKKIKYISDKAFQT